MAEMTGFDVVGRNLDHVARMHRDYDALAPRPATHAGGGSAGEAGTADERRELLVRSRLVIYAAAADVV
jgi:hypothetical protein